MLTALGLVLGLAGAAAVTRYLNGLLFGLTPLDPATFAGVSLMFAAIAILASWSAVRRATHVDPLIALGLWPGVHLPADRILVAEFAPGERPVDDHGARVNRSIPGLEATTVRAKPVRWSG